MTNKPEILLIGGGGHCKSVIDVIEAENRFKIAGIIDIPQKIGNKVLEYKIIASDENIPELAQKYEYFFITLGFIDSPLLRIKIYNLLKSLKVKIPVIVSPNAYISKHSKINEGTIIMHGAIVNAGSTVGANCIINSKSLIEHDCSIGNNCHISTGSVINGGCSVGDECFIGSNSVIKQGTNITNGVIVGAGAFVRKNISEKGIYVGNPAKRILKI